MRTTRRTFLKFCADVGVALAKQAKPNWLAIPREVISIVTKSSFVFPLVFPVTFTATPISDARKTV